MLFGSLSCSGPKLLKKYLFLTHTAINPAQLPKKRKKKKSRLASVTDIMQKKKSNWSKCIQTHCSGMRKYSLCGDEQKWATDFGAVFRISVNVLLLSPKCGGATRYQVLCHEKGSLSSVCGPSSGGAVKTLCSAADSHTVTRIRRERLVPQNYFSMCQKLLFNL